MEEKVDIINYKNPYDFWLYCETADKGWFEVKRSTYENCKNKYKEFEDKFGDNIQLEILYLVEASY